MPRCEHCADAKPADIASCVRDSRSNAFGTVAAAGMRPCRTASAGLTALAYRVRRRTEETPYAADDFLPHLGFVTGLLFTFVLSVEIMPILIVGGCR